LDDLGYVLIKGLDFLSRHGNSKCECCQTKYPTQDMISIENMKEDLDFQFINNNWVIYHLILDDKVNRHENTNIVRMCSPCYKKKLSKVKTKYMDAYSKMNLVKTYPANYQGSFNLDQMVDPKIETYNFSGGKWNTINKMKFWAAWEGYNIIYNLTYNYQYDKKAVTGIFAKLAK
jgi:hypothetical protein